MPEGGGGRDSLGYVWGGNVLRRSPNLDPVQGYLVLEMFSIPRSREVLERSYLTPVVCVKNKPCIRKAGLPSKLV